MPDLDYPEDLAGAIEEIKAYRKYYGKLTPAALDLAKTLDEQPQRTNMGVSLDLPVLGGPAYGMNFPVITLLHLMNRLQQLIDVVLGQSTKISEQSDEIRDFQRTFDLQWRANMRGIEMYREAHGPEWELKWPDKGDMVCWLIEQLEAQNDSATFHEWDALHDLVARKFKSGNSVPVERITIKAEEYFAALRQPAEEKGGDDEKT